MMSSSREVSSLPLAPSLISILSKGGFHYLSDLEEMQPIELSQELGIDLQSAISILGSVPKSISLSATSSQNANPNAEMSTLLSAQGGKSSSVGYGAGVVSARDLITRSLGERQHIITRCRALDTVLGGGVPIGQLVRPGYPPSHTFLPEY
jgi:hypothetical protein